MHGYCSDITRMFVVGEPTAEVRDAYAVLVEAQERGRAARRPSAPRAKPSTPPRARVIADAGYGEYFVHRTGHGIGTEAHEDPYVVAGNRTPLAPGHAFSIEPGIYVPGRFGLRLEDIVVATAGGARAPQPGAARSRDRRLTARGAARPRHGAGAVGHRRPAVLLGHDASARGGHRLRLAAADHVRRRWRSCRRDRGFGDTGTGALVRNVGAAVMALAAARRAAGVVRAARCRGAAGSVERATRESRHASRRWSASRLRRTTADGAQATHDADARVRPPARPRRPGRRGRCALVGAASFAGGDYALSLARLVVGAAVPRRGHRRDAARPLVPRAARAWAATRSRSW